MNTNLMEVMDMANKSIYPSLEVKAKEAMEINRQERFNKLLIEHLERFAPEKLKQERSNEEVLERYLYDLLGPTGNGRKS